MKLVNKRDGIIASALHNARGYPMNPDLETEMGFKDNELDELFEKVVSNENYNLNEIEKTLVGKSLKACLKYIDEFEYPALFDCEKKEVEEFYKEFVK